MDFISLIYNTDITAFDKVIDFFNAESLGYMSSAIILSAILEMFFGLRYDKLSKGLVIAALMTAYFATFHKTAVGICTELASKAINNHREYDGFGILIKDADKLLKKSDLLSAKEKRALRGFLRGKKLKKEDELAIIKGIWLYFMNSKFSGFFSTSIISFCAFFFLLSVLISKLLFALAFWSNIVLCSLFCIFLVFPSGWGLFSALIKTTVWCCLCPLLTAFISLGWGVLITDLTSPSLIAVCLLLTLNSFVILLVPYFAMKFVSGEGAAGFVSGMQSSIAAIGAVGGSKLIGKAQGKMALGTGMMFAAPAASVVGSLASSYIKGKGLKAREYISNVKEGGLGNNKYKEFSDYVNNAQSNREYFSNSLDENSTKGFSSNGISPYITPVSAPVRSVADTAKNFKSNFAKQQRIGEELRQANGNTNTKNENPVMRAYLNNKEFRTFKSSIRNGVDFNKRAASMDNKIKNIPANAKSKIKDRLNIKKK